MDDEVHCRLTSSRLLAVLLTAAHAGAGCAAFMLPLGAASRAVLLVALAAHLGWLVRRVAWRAGPKALVGLQWSHGDLFVAERRDGTRVTARLIGPALVHPWLISMRLQPLGRGPWARFSVAVPADGCPREAHRALRVALRHLATPA